MLVVVGLVLSALAGSHRVSGGVAQAAAALVLVVIAVASAAAVLFTVRVVVTRRALARRVRLVVLAPDSFAPSMDGVLRCAAQLSRVRRLVGGWFDRRASAVRVLLDTDGEGADALLTVVPGRSLPGGPLGARQLRPGTGPHPDPEAEPTRGRGQAGRGECVWCARSCVCARPSSEPLAHLALDPDPLQSFAHVLAGTDPASGGGRGRSPAVPGGRAAAAATPAAARGAPA